MAITTTTDTRESMSRRAFLSLFTSRAASQVLKPVTGTLAVLAARPTEPQKEAVRSAVPGPAPGERAPPLSSAAARRLAYFRAVVPASDKSDP